MDERPLIIACDFDGTLCENVWPEIGSPNYEMISLIKRAKENGFKIILWTCRVDDKLQSAVEWCRKYGVEFDAVNNNLPELIETFGNNCRKVYADYYIDDKNYTCLSLHLPYKKGD